MNHQDKKNSTYKTMEVFSRLDNHFIKYIDKISVVPKVEKPFKNSLKTTVKVPTFQVIGQNSSVYSQTFTIDIPRAYDNLSQLYAKVTMNIDDVSSTVESYFATKIFKKIVLKTKQGTILQELVPEYLQSRTDELYDSPVYSDIAVGLEPDVDFDGTNTPSVFVPLFFFFSQNETTFLNTRKLEQLQLEFVTNTDKDVMGLSADLILLTTELYAKYHDEDTSNEVDDRIYAIKKAVPKYLVSSYNIFKEDEVTVPIGATSAKLLLRCPYPTFAIHLTLVDYLSNKVGIKNLKMKVGNHEFLDLDYRINYELYGSTKGHIPSGTFTYFFSISKRRGVDSGLITFSQEMYPMYIEVTFDTIATNSYTLKTFSEYRTNFSVDDRGLIRLSNSAFPDEGLNQSNSSTEAAMLSGSG